ncbi:DUF3887 domain-containing protein [Cyanobium sp. WAJ14-Wanaka]|uniref:DUF3887 domain-containing protein n=1 Tax=Cyanobium sp. WAJ14-Wanaka TaxID=2823725 RepID=UPI0020CC0323|nr:DUF3887 domain-containing protein [Cyanobium sp. WAJ14-Wanaka]MCP9774708.1 DUF3887 domain-containing protein [Cyanobium sp. WAJ14-Wanaka]
MQRFFDSLSKTLLASALVGGGLIAGPILPNRPAFAQTPSAIDAAALTPVSETPLSVEQARAAANTVLDAVKRRDGNARYNQFADELKAVTSPSMVQRTMKSWPKLLSWKVLGVSRGSRSTTVEAALTTSAGIRNVFIVFNSKVKLIGYHIDRSDLSDSKVAIQFVQTLADGQYISARGFLSLDLQKDVSAASLQRKWQELQQLTGNFVRVKRAVEASSNSTGKLVLVLTEFNRLTDTLFVVMGPNNQITGIDFPIDPLKPEPVR